MERLPIFLDVKQQPCLVVGAGAVAARKAALLSAAGASVIVVAPVAGRQMQELVDTGKARIESRPFVAEDLEDKALVIAATDDALINREIAELARARFIPVNVVTGSGDGSFVMPSIIDRSPVQIAVSTGGASPVLARLLRTRLEICTPAAYGRLARLVESCRARAKEVFPQVERRRAFWESVLEGPVAEMVYAGRDDAAREELRRLLDEVEGKPPHSGEVYLVGAGPGDPDLLTFRAVRLMQKADVVVYDRLVSQPVLDLVRRDAEQYYAGKERSRHAIPQENINQLLVRLAREGKRVLRLKGGDPFIFGRGGEEIASLIEEDVPFQVVPGITAAAGCAAYAGIPLTHRDYAQACIFVTGHLKDGSVDLNWEMLAHERQTVVFYMGLHGVRVICEQLKIHGLAGSTPAALITQGTTPDQRVLFGDLESLPGLVENNDVKPPTLIIVGEVVRLHEKLQWFHPETDVTAEAVRNYSGVSGLDGRDS